MVERASGYDASDGSRSPTSTPPARAEQRAARDVAAPGRGRTAAVRARRLGVPRPRPVRRPPRADPAARRPSTSSRSRWKKRPGRVCAVRGGDSRWSRRTRRDARGRHRYRFGRDRDRARGGAARRRGVGDRRQRRRARGRARERRRLRGDAGARCAGAGEWFDPLPGRAAGIACARRVEPARTSPSTRSPTSRTRSPRTSRGSALVSGPSGTEAIEHCSSTRRDWLAPGASFVCEIAPHQADAMSEHARALGYARGAGARRPHRPGPRARRARRG